jgi:hypothetical protein
MFQIKSSLMKFCLYFLFVLLINVKTYAQTYWQQKIDYQINVKLDDQLHLLSGDIKMVYHNNSNSALSEIWMHIWPNAYKNDKTAFAIQQLENLSKSFHYADESKRGYIDSLNFMVNNFKVMVQANERYPDIVKLILPTSLAPGDSIIISSPFRVKIPNSFSRLGHVNNAYQITQWYPKPAVYDANGWHPIPYLDQGEFYSEFGTFDVKITLPKNYVVASTGELQNEEEKIFLDALSDSTKKIKTYSDVDTFPKSSSAYKTLHYIQNNIHDFAWFADKRFHVLASEVELPSSKRKVKTYVFFTNKYAEYWKEASKYINDAVYYYSLWIGEYPYNYCSAVDGALSAGSGMEYPMVTIIGEMSDAKTLDQVIAHEVGHNWFYGIVGSNEREYAWMDEGINSFYENRYMKLKYSDGTMIPKEKQNILIKTLGLHHFPYGYEHYLSQQLSASDGKAQAINTHAEEFVYLNYGVILYTKTSLVLKYLEQYLGVEKFDSVMKIYFDEWKYKHPQPSDIQFLFERECNEKLDWFFKDILDSKEDIDFKISEIKKENKQIRVKIKNNTEIAGPVFVSSIDKNGKVLENYKTQAFYGSVYVYFDSIQAKKIVIDPLYVIPESNRNNNTVVLKPIKTKIEPLRLQAFTGLNRPDRTNLYLAPALGYNTSDGALLGVALYNNFFPFKKLEWSLLPMYGIRSERLNGAAQITKHSYPKRFAEVATKFTLYSFSDLNTNNTFTQSSVYKRFFKTSIGTELTLKPSSARSRISTKFSYRFVFTRDDYTFTADSLYFGNVSEIVYSNSYHQFKFTRTNARAINPNSIHVLYEYANNLRGLPSNLIPDFFNDIKETHHKIFVVFKQKVNYGSSRKGLQIRAFAGTIFANNNRLNSSSFFSLSGNNDYTYDKAFFDRNNLNRNQMHELDGAFKSNTFSPTVRNLIGVNIKAPLKMSVPIGIFADAAFSNRYQEIANSDFDMDFGVYVPLVNDVIEIYFPIVYNQRLFSTNTYKEVVRFMIDFQMLQPLNLKRSLQLF